MAIEKGQEKLEKQKNRLAQMIGRHPRKNDSAARLYSVYRKSARRQVIIG